jgi:hypothetical protein
MSKRDLQVGDTVRVQYGPYRSTAEVVRIIDAGAVIRPNGVATLVGFEHLVEAPNGAPLTQDAGEDFIGRAHWGSVKILAE